MQVALVVESVSVAGVSEEAASSAAGEAAADSTTPGWGPNWQHQQQLLLSSPCRFAGAYDHVADSYTGIAKVRTLLRHLPPPQVVDVVRIFQNSFCELLSRYLQKQCRKLVAAKVAEAV